MLKILFVWHDGQAFVGYYDADKVRLSALRKAVTQYDLAGAEIIGYVPRAA